MSIGKNIAKFRKANRLTQEELGCRLGVTNQAVSKWESEVSMPDILLLPKIADALGVSLNELYGRTEPKETSAICADQFPEAAFRSLHRLFFDHTVMRFTHIGASDAEQIAYQMEALEKGQYLGCVSNQCGAVVMKNDLAIIDRNYKSAGSEKLFHSSGIAKKLNLLSDKNVRTVLAWEYQATFETAKDRNRCFSVEEIAEGCGLSENEAGEALDKLVEININQTYIDRESYKSIYVFQISAALYALAIFKLAEMLTDDKVWTVVRDTSIISDYAFRA